MDIKKAIHWMIVERSTVVETYEDGGEVIEAYDMAIQALMEKAERENTTCV